MKQSFSENVVPYLLQSNYGTFIRRMHDVRRDEAWQRDVDWRSYQEHERDVSFNPQRGAGHHSTTQSSQIWSPAGEQHTMRLAAGAAPPSVGQSFDQQELRRHDVCVAAANWAASVGHHDGGPGTTQFRRGGAGGAQKQPVLKRVRRRNSRGQEGGSVLPAGFHAPGPVAEEGSQNLGFPPPGSEVEGSQTRTATPADATAFGSWAAIEEKFSVNKDLRPATPDNSTATPTSLTTALPSLSGSSPGLVWSGLVDGGEDGQVCSFFPYSQYRGRSKEVFSLVNVKRGLVEKNIFYE